MADGGRAFIKFAMVCTNILLQHIFIKDVLTSFLKFQEISKSMMQENLVHYLGIKFCMRHARNLHRKVFWVIKSRSSGLDAKFLRDASENFERHNLIIFVNIFNKIFNFNLTSVYIIPLTEIDQWHWSQIHQSQSSFGQRRESWKFGELSKWPILGWVGFYYFRRTSWKSSFPDF